MTRVRPLTKPEWELLALLDRGPRTGITKQVSIMRLRAHGLARWEAHPPHVGWHITDKGREVLKGHAF